MPNFINKSHDCFFILLFTFVCINAWAFPEKQNYHINDYAGLLSAAEEEKLDAQLKAVQIESEVQVQIVTIPSIRHYGYLGQADSFATELFNRWGIGNATLSNGVLLLISKEDRYIRIELGNGYGRDYDDVSTSIIAKEIAPFFKHNEFYNGIQAGINAILAELLQADVNNSGDLLVKAKTKISTLYGNGLSTLDKTTHWFSQFIPTNTVTTVVIIIGALISSLIGYAAIRKWRRNKPRNCPNCNRIMQRLNENKDDHYLLGPQALEERLKSVDYDVWLCNLCRHTTITRYSRWFSAYGLCRGCNYKTLEADTTIIEHATTSSSGKKRIDESCKNCDYTNTYYRKIPKKSNSSSGSSSGFYSGSSSRSSGGSSGGRSSGGGGSGSW